MWEGLIQSVEGLARTRLTFPICLLPHLTRCCRLVCECGSMQAGDYVPAHHTSQGSLESIPPHVFFWTKPRALVQLVVTKVSTGYGNGAEQTETQVQVPNKKGWKKGGKSKSTKYVLKVASENQPQERDQCQGRACNVPRARLLLLVVCLPEPNK